LALRLREGNSYNRSSDLLHIFISLDWIASDSATFRRFVHCSISGRALQDVAVSGEMQISRSSS